MVGTATTITHSCLVIKSPCPFSTWVIFIGWCSSMSAALWTPILVTFWRVLWEESLAVSSEASSGRLKLTHFLGFVVLSTSFRSGPESARCFQRRAHLLTTACTCRQLCSNNRGKGTRPEAQIKHGLQRAHQPWLSKLHISQNTTVYI